MNESKDLFGGFYSDRHLSELGGLVSFNRNQRIPNKNFKPTVDG